MPRRKFNTLQDVAVALGLGCVAVVILYGILRQIYDPAEHPVGLPAEVAQPLRTGYGAVIVSTIVGLFNFLFKSKVRIKRDDGTQRTAKIQPIIVESGLWLMYGAAFLGV